VLVRGGGSEQKLDLVMQVPERPAEPAAEVVWRKLGLRLAAVNADAAPRSSQQLHGGLLVVDVRPEGAAARAGIQRGDVLVGLHQWEMLAMENVRWVLTHPDLATFQPLRFYIVRAGQVHRGSLQQLD